MGKRRHRIGSRPNSQPTSRPERESLSGGIVQNTTECDSCGTDLYQTTSEGSTEATFRSPAVVSLPTQTAECDAVDPENSNSAARQLHSAAPHAAEEHENLSDEAIPIIAVSVPAEEDSLGSPAHNNPIQIGSNNNCLVSPPTSDDLKDEDNIFVLSFRFNQDGSCFVASTTTGFRVYTCVPLTEFARREGSTATLLALSKTSRQAASAAKILDGKTSLASGPCLEDDADPEAAAIEPTVMTTTTSSSHSPVQSSTSSPTATKASAGATVRFSGSAVTYPVLSVSSSSITPAVAAVGSGFYLLFPGRCADFRIRVVCMLYRSQSFALVTAAEPTKVHLWNDRDQRVMGWLRCGYPVVNIVMRREVFAVITIGATYVYLSGTATPLHVIPTASNTTGVAALSASPDVLPWVLCVPALTPGGCRIQWGDSREPLVFQAHQSAVGLLALNYRGSIVASASVKGTVIRLFATLDGSLLHEFRLGVMPHTVRCIAISRDDAFLAVASQTSTVHVFKLLHENPLAETDEQIPPTEQPVHGGGLLRATLKSVLPRYFTLERAFTTLTLAVDKSLDVRVSGTNALQLHVQQTDCAYCRARLLEAAGTGTSAGLMANAFLLRPKVPQQLAENAAVAQQRCSWNDNCLMTGPLMTFVADDSSRLLIVHHDGFLYEATLDPLVGGACKVVRTTPWFAPRRDFVIERQQKQENVLVREGTEDGCC